MARVVLRRRRRPRGGRVPPRQRGIALVVVLTMITVLTALAVDMQYNARVDMHLAAGARDDMRATYMARSAYNIARLVLYFQRAMDNVWNPAQQGLNQLAGGGMGAFGKPNVYEMVPPNYCSLLGGVSSGALNSLIGGFLGGGGGDDLLPEDEPQDSGLDWSGTTGLDNIQGDCEALISSEHKINVNKLAGFRAHQEEVLRSVAGWRAGPARALFERTSESGEDMKLETILASIKDYIDPDDQGSYLPPEALDSSMARGMVGDLFQPDISGNEDSRFADADPFGDDTAKAKDHRFDTLDELRLVPGIDEAFMRAFGDQLTVFPAHKIDLTAPGGRDLALRMVMAMTWETTPVWQDPNAMQQVYELMASPELVSMLDTPQGFIQFAEEQFGIEGANKLHLQQVLDDRSFVYRIEAAGQVGSARKKITAVLDNRFDQEILYYYRIE